MTSTEKPLLMRPRLVVETLRGNKTQTRRVVDPQPHPLNTPGEEVGGYWSRCPPGSRVFRWFSRIPTATGYRSKWGMFGRSEPRFAAGDVVYLRESVYQERRFAVTGPAVWGDRVRFLDYYGTLDDDDAERDARAEADGFALRPSIHVPKWASRASVLIVDVKLVRLQSINAKEAREEGVDPRVGNLYVGYLPRFVELWNSINAERGFSYESNPWVYVYAYELAKAPLGKQPVEAERKGARK